MEVRLRHIAITWGAVLFITSATAALGQVYGNAAGCKPGVPEDDGYIRFSDNMIEFWESVCELPGSPNFDGAPMTLFCMGEGEEWDMTASLTDEGDVIRLEYEGGTVDLNPCD
jgi:hypothetical protein